MYSRVPNERRIYTCAGNQYFGSPKTSSTCYRAPCCCRRILPFSPFHAFVCYHRGQAHDTQQYGATNAGLHRMLFVVVFRSLLSKYTVTGPSRSLSRGASSSPGRTGLHILTAHCSNLTEQQLSIPSLKEYTIPNSYLLWSPVSRSVPCRQYTAFE
jgi:hypothetical protein